MACALPVVATRVGGNTDIIRDGINGILVEPQNPDQLFAAMQKILTNKALAEKLGSEARKTVEGRFSMDYVVGHYINLYQDLLSS